jgi:putative transposase
VDAVTQQKVIKDVQLQTERTKMTLSRILSFYEISKGTFYGWSNCKPAIPVSRRNVLKALPEEEQAVIEFRQRYRSTGYRKLTWMMNDAEVCALSESAVYSILKRHDLLAPPKPNNAETEKEYRHKPKAVHEHWHTDIAYIKVRGVFYFLIIVLDGYSRYILDWELMPDMLGSSVRAVIRRVRKKYPHFRPKLINDNGSQFISRDFKLMVSQLDIQQVFTRRNHPQTNGKAERLNGIVKQEAIRPASPVSFQDAHNVIADFVTVYNNQRLHTGIRFLRPADVFHRRDRLVLEQRTQRLHTARNQRIRMNKAFYQQQPLLKNLKQKSEFRQA